MAKFICDNCGKCCRSFGAFITIERQLDDRNYYCRYGIKNEIFPVSVQPAFADAIADAYEERCESGQKELGKACVFLQENPSGNRFSCAIYPSRPAVCRDFRCYRMVIRHKAGGELRGRVIGKHDLRTEDTELATLWKEKIAPLPCPGGANPSNKSGSGQADDREWLKTVLAVLKAHGYSGDPVED